MTLPPDMCRLCASNGHLCVPIFGEDGDKILLKHKLRICSPVIVKEKDSLPKQVCLNCLSSLDQTYEFYQQAKMAQLKLKELIDRASSRKRRRQSDSGNDETKKKFQFGSTIMTYPAESPLFAVMGENTKQSSNECKIGVKVMPEAKSSPCNPGVIVKANSSNIITDSIDADKGENPDAEDSASTQPKESAMTSENPAKVKRELQSQEKTPQESKSAQSSQQNPTDSTSNADQKKITESPKKSLSLKPSQKKTKNLSNDGYEDCRYCERKFAPHLLPEHEAIWHKGKNLYLCEECNVNFFNEEAYSKHNQKRHEQTKTRNAE